MVSPLSLTSLSTLLLATLALPALVSAQFDARTDPACCLSCWHAVLSSPASESSALSIGGGYTGGMEERCKDEALVGRLTACWDVACIDPEDIVAGQNAWNAACAYAQSTAAVYSSVHTSAALQSANSASAAAATPLTVTSPVRTSTVAAPSPSSGAARLRVRADGGELVPDAHRPTLPLEPLPIFERKRAGADLGDGAENKRMRRRAL
ncbi:hypothetical protein JCM10908_006265 [Rhodotorula pacifica]|uniref:uncharacterized protein n=1 Tax=Rhodotorula pacifica TaxID=1495444 RepID=UPI00317DC7B4